jgi:hypothetical protein
MEEEEEEGRYTNGTLNKHMSIQKTSEGVKKNQLDANLFLVYFVNLYMFRPYLCPLSGGKPYVYNNWYLLFFLDDCLLSCFDWISNPTRTTAT